MQALACIYCEPHYLAHMRLDLLSGGKRPWWLRLGFALARWRLGVIPGPTVFITYRPDLVSARFRGYLMRPMCGRGSWTRGEAELMAAFVSKLNTCHF